MASNELTEKKHEWNYIVLASLRCCQKGSKGCLKTLNWKEIFRTVSWVWNFLPSMSLHWFIFYNEIKKWTAYQLIKITDKQTLQTKNWLQGKSWMVERKRRFLFGNNIFVHKFWLNCNLQFYDYLSTSQLSCQLHHRTTSST